MLHITKTKTQCPESQWSVLNFVNIDRFSPSHSYHHFWFSSRQKKKNTPWPNILVHLGKQLTCFIPPSGSLYQFTGIISFSSWLTHHEDHWPANDCICFSPYKTGEMLANLVVVLNNSSTPLSEITASIPARSKKINLLHLQLWGSSVTFWTQIFSKMKPISTPERNPQPQPHKTAKWLIKWLQRL